MARRDGKDVNENAFNRINERITINSDITEKIVDDIVKKYCESLDCYVDKNI